MIKLYTDHRPELQLAALQYRHFIHYVIFPLQPKTSQRIVRMFVVVLLLFCFIFWLTYAHYFRPYYILKRTMRIPGPSPKVYSGNCSNLDYLQSTKNWMSQYGPTFICYFGIKPVVMTQDLEIIKSVMVKNFDNFINRPYLPRLVMKGTVHSLFRLRDEQWRRIHRILTPAFSSKKLRMLSPLIQESCERLKDKMAALSDTSNSVDVCKLFGIFTMEVTLATAFSRDISSDSSNGSSLTKAAASIFQSSATPKNNLTGEWLAMTLSHFPWIEPLLRYFARRTKVARNFDFLDETALTLIEDRRNSMKTIVNAANDILQLMLEAHDENKDTKCSDYLSSEEIVGAIITIIVAGYESTMNALSYTAYLLALNPTIQDRLIREINDYYDVNPDSSLYDAAENIKYVEMVLYESMRMFPPTPKATRECKQTCAVTNELIIEKGCELNFPIFLLHCNPEYWPNPEVFDPERFNPNSGRSYPAYAYLPFGEGPRQCIGKRLALMEAKMTLVAILKDLHFKSSADTEVPLDLASGFAMYPKNGIKFFIESN